MAEADKDGRIAQWFAQQHAILGMELGASCDELRENLRAAAQAFPGHRTRPGEQCEYATASEGNPRPNSCPLCPIIPCVDCGGPDDRHCECWIDLEGMPLADLKAIFARDGLSLELPEEPT